MAHWKLTRKINAMKRELDQAILFAESIQKKRDISDWQRGYHAGQAEAFKAEKLHLEEVLTG